MPAALQAADGCGFEFRDELTPVVRSVQPAQGGIGTVLTIAGSGFDRLQARPALLGSWDTLQGGSPRLE